MTTAPTLAFQVWDAVGWAGQACFFLRMATQWIHSERARRSVVPTSFWTLSLAGSVLLLVYEIHRRDPVFLLGILVNMAIYGRNLMLVRRERSGGDGRRSPWVPIAVGLAAFAALVTVSLHSPKMGLARFDAGDAWMWFGFAAVCVWSSRFVVQWILSERAGRSVMPALFFQISLVGSIALFIYAVHRLDWVMMAAHVLNPIPYTRNLVLIRRARRARQETGAPAGGG